MQKLFVNILCVFIPSRKIRHKIRYFIQWHSIGFYIRKLFTKKIVYDYVFSLGDNCFTAQALDHANLRKFSSPFDWVMGSSLEKRIDLLTHNFDNFFNKNDFEFIKSKEKTKDGPYVNRTDKNTGLIHWHDFSFDDCNFDAEFPTVKEKYERRISRLLNKIKKDHGLAIFAELENSKHRTNEEIIELASKLDNRFDNKLDFFYVKYNNDLRPDQSKIIQNNGRLIIGEYSGIKYEWNTKEHIISERAFIPLLAFIKIKKVSI